MSSIPGILTLEFFFFECITEKINEFDDLGLGINGFKFFIYHKYIEMLRRSYFSSEGETKVALVNIFY